MVKVFKCSQRVYPCLLVTLWPTCCKTFPISTQFVQTDIQTAGFFRRKTAKNFNFIFTFASNPSFFLDPVGSLVWYFWPVDDERIDISCSLRSQSPGAWSWVCHELWQLPTKNQLSLGGCSLLSAAQHGRENGGRAAGHPEQCSEELYGTAQWPGRTLQTNHRTHRLPGHTTGARAETSSVHCWTSMFNVQSSHHL